MVKIKRHFRKLSLMNSKQQSDLWLKRFPEVKTTKQGNKLIVEIPDDVSAVEVVPLLEEAKRRAGGAKQWAFHSVEL